MTLDRIPSAAPGFALLDFTLQVERLYTALIHVAKTSGATADSPNDEPSLGGKFLFARELTPQGRALLVAGNIAGAASLAATADPDAGKQAIRDGVADFLVNSLDEALRILKNEIRKGETVAVCIASATETVEREMRQRGVAPDLLPPFSSSVVQPSSQTLRQIEHCAEPLDQVLVTWRVATAPAQWLPKLDALFFDCLRTTAGTEGYAARRWLRLAPRYLGRLAHDVRVLHCQPVIAREFISRTREAVDRGEIAVEVQVHLNSSKEVFLFRPLSRQTG